MKKLGLMLCIIIGLVNIAINIKMYKKVSLNTYTLNRIERLSENTFDKESNDIPIAETYENAEWAIDFGKVIGKEAEKIETLPNNLGYEYTYDFGETTLGTINSVYSFMTENGFELSIRDDENGNGSYYIDYKKDKCTYSIYIDQVNKKFKIIIQEQK